MCINYKTVGMMIMRKCLDFLFLKFLPITMILFLLSCKFLNSNPPESESTAIIPKIANIEVTPANTTIANPLSQQFTATGIYSNNITRDVTNLVSWVSEDPTIAVISDVTYDTDNPKGKASALETGTTKISARYGNIRGLTTLTVTPAPLETIQITPAFATLSLTLTPTVQFKATGIYADGTKMDFTEFVTWSSSDTDVVIINNSTGHRGLASSVSAGASNITAIFQEKSGSTTLELSAATLSSSSPFNRLQLSPKNPSIAKGTDLQFKATAVLSDGKTQDLTKSSIWNSNNLNAASISNADGTVGLAEATSDTATDVTTEIYATFDDVTGDTTRLTITQAYLYTLEVYPAHHSIAFGRDFQLTATGIFKFGATYSRQDLTSSVIWFSSDTDVATVCNATDCKGVISTTRVPSVLQRSTTITIKSPLSSNVTGNTTLTVNPPRRRLTAIQVTPSNPTLYLDSSQEFVAIATYSDGTNISYQDITQEVVWSVSDDTVAVIRNGESNNGKVFFRNAGESTIKATLGNINGTSLLTIKPESYLISSLQVTPSPSVINLGTSQQLTATGTFSNGSDTFTMDLTDFVYWESSNSGMAAVSNGDGSKGTVTGVTVGSVTISAHWSTLISSSNTYSQKDGTTSLTVSSSLDSLSISPEQPILKVGETQQLTAKASFTGTNNMQDVTESAVWFSSRSATAAVSNTSGNQGKVYAISVGNATITVRLGGKSQSISFTVQ